MNIIKYKAIFIGILSALFFAVTFIINKLMANEGGSWIWSSSLRFYWMLPFFLIIVLLRKNLLPVILSITEKPIAWLVWSTIGFGVFYAPLTYSASFSPSWLVASSWQFTIIAGILISPFIYKEIRISVSSFLFSGLIFFGILVMQISQIDHIEIKNLLIGGFWIIIAAFAYPLGNRKMILLLQGQLDVYQRILGMIICSLPFWIILNIYGICIEHSLPNHAQFYQTFIVALFSGVIATTLFFYAAELVHHDLKALASVEATQSGEVLFTLLGEIILFHIALPDPLSMIGIGLVIFGMILHSTHSK